MLSSKFMFYFKYTDILNIQINKLFDYYRWDYRILYAVIRWYWNVHKYNK